MRLVLDTNVIISSIVTPGAPRKLFIRGISGEYIVLISTPILKEIYDVLSRPKFRMSASEIRRILDLIRKSSNHVVVKSKFEVIENDPDDDIIINTAYDGNANYIVSGDAHLLSIGSFHGIKIVGVGKMLEILDKK